MPQLFYTMTPQNLRWHFPETKSALSFSQVTFFLKETNSLVFHSPYSSVIGHDIEGKIKMMSDIGCWIIGTFYLSNLTTGQRYIIFILTLKTIHRIDIFRELRCFQFLIMSVLFEVVWR